METYATTKGQIVIPVALRRKYGITEGTKIVIVDNGNDIVLRPMTRERITRLRGSLKEKGTLQMLLDERREDKEKEDAAYKGA